MAENTVNPYKNLQSTKKTQVALMFNNIAKRYDFLNHFLSLGIDKLWRSRTVSMLKGHPIDKLLDIATGTGDLAIAALRLKPRKIVGVDISAGMLKIGKEKIKKRNLEDIIVLKEGDSEHLEFPENYFDAVTSAFGVRNFENLDAGLAEMYRVLKPNAKLAILEFSRPTAFPVKQLYHFYFHTILPVLGKQISSDNSAYTYLPESVYAFPDREKFLEHLRDQGFRETTFKSLSLGIVCIYTGSK